MTGKSFDIPTLLSYQSVVNKEIKQKISSEKSNCIPYFIFSHSNFTYTHFERVGILQKFCYSLLCFYKCLCRYKRRDLPRVHIWIGTKKKFPLKCFETFFFIRSYLNHLDSDVAQIWMILMTTSFFSKERACQRFPMTSKRPFQLPGRVD